MHICFIGEYPENNQAIGGVSAFLKTIAEALHQKGHEVSIISFSCKKAGWSKEDGLNVYRVHPSRWRFANFIRIAKEINEVLKALHHSHPIDIIETAENGLCFLKKPTGSKFIVRLHGGHMFFATYDTTTRFSKWEKWQERKSLQKADGIIAVSQFVLKETAKHYPFILKKPHEVIYNPVRLEEFDLRSKSTESEVSILFFGALTEKKGVRQLIKAMPIVNKTIKNVVLNIFGRDVPVRPTGASFIKILESEVESAGLCNVTMHPPLDKKSMVSALAKASIVALPSHMEAMPLAWLETLAMGKPLVASKLGPGPEIIEHGVNGMLCDPFNPADIAEKIIFLASNTDKAQAMANNGRLRIQKSFTVEPIVEKNLHFFKELTDY